MSNREHSVDSSSRFTKSLSGEIVVAAGLVIAGVLLRFACTDLPNFAPVAAIGLFAGFFLSRKTIALAVPLAIMLVSNIWLGGYHWMVMLSVYACYMAMPLAGGLLKQVRTGRDHGIGSAITSRLAPFGLALTGSVLFFVVTNFAVWASATDQTIWQCYAAAIPFFRYTLCGDVIFTFAIFAGYDVVLMMLASVTRKPELSGDAS